MAKDWLAKGLSLEDTVLLKSSPFLRTNQIIYTFAPSLRGTMPRQNATPPNASGKKQFTAERKYQPVPSSPSRHSRDHRAY